MGERVTTKWFRIIEAGIRAQLAPGMTIILIGHGWAQPEPGKYVHPFEVRDDNGKFLGSVDIDHSELAKLISEGKIEPLD